MEMIWLTVAVIWGMFVWCVIRARKEQGNVLQRTSTYIYKRICIWGLTKKKIRMQDRQVRQTLASLHPGKEMAVLLTEYYTGKIRVMMLILLIGSGVACLSKLAGEGELMLSDGVLSRPNKKQTVALQAVVDGEEETVRERIMLEVNERKLSKLEAEKLCQELLDRLDERILGQNVSLQEIRQDLELPYEVEGYPFSIAWKSNSELLDRDGRIYTEDLEQPREVSLEATIIYGEYEWPYNFSLVICPPLRTQREQLIYDLTRLGREAEDRQKYDEGIILPTTLNGKQVTWKIEQESSGTWIFLISFLAAVIVYFMKDKDLQKELAQRRVMMKLEYPIIVSKYALFLEAGLTVRGAFMKICRDHYEKNPESVQPIYEEMYYSCNELKAGVSESRVYENFGRRTGSQEYTRLCALLCQNLKKGNTALARRLREECEGVARENLQLRKRQGEEAGTKLLMPMGMLLIMILVLIMLPAFSDLNI